MFAGKWGCYQRNRKKIKDDYVQAERVEAELEKIEEAPQSSELEDILKKMQEDIDLKPRTWENYRSLFYTKYNGNENDSIKV